MTRRGPGIPGANKRSTSPIKWGGGGKEIFLIEMTSALKYDGPVGFGQE